ncbi:MAG: type IV secretion system protein [Sulfurovum sp.]
MKTLKLILVGLCLAFFAPTQVSAAANHNNLPSKVQEKFKSMVSQYTTKLSNAAKSLFWILAGIELVIVFGMMALRQELEFGGIMAELVKVILLWGLFILIVEKVDVLENVFNGFNKLGADLSNTNFNEISDKLFKMWDTVWKKVDNWGMTGVGNSILLITAAIPATMAIVALIALALMYYAFAIFSIYVGIFWLAFGALSHTRSWAYNAIISPIRYGAKWMMALLMIGIVFSMIDDALVTLQPTSSDKEIINNVMVILVVSWMMLIVGLGIGGFVDSYFTGHGGGDSNRGVAMALGAMGGAAGAAGAMAASGVGGLMGGMMGAAEGAKAGSKHVQAAKEGGQGTSMMGNMRTVASGALGGMMGGAYEGARGNGMGAAKMRGEQAGSFGAADPRQKSKEFAQKVKSALAGSAPAQKNDSGTSGTIS